MCFASLFIETFSGIPKSEKLPHEKTSRQKTAAAQKKGAFLLLRIESIIARLAAKSKLILEKLEILTVSVLRKKLDKN